MMLRLKIWNGLILSVLIVPLRTKAKNRVPEKVPEFVVNV